MDLSAMTFEHTKRLERVGIIGTGVIGSSWAALFLARGVGVTATDPAVSVGDRLRRDIDACWPSLERQGLVVDGATPDALTMVASTSAVADDVDFIQENGPERIEAKHAIYRELDAVAASDVVIASSSSGLMASDIQTACSRHPERVVIGHPFNPPHLIPLVEVVGGRLTSAAAVRRAMAVYESIGKRPIHITAELPGHVTNRLQAALWREAYWLIEQGVVSVADIDLAISSGPGLRWSLLGPFVTQHLSGGDAGLAHVLEHLGPPMVAWWETFRTPAWTPELRALLVAGVDAELDGIDQPAMVAERDHLLEQLVIAKTAAHQLPTYKKQ
jgi:carnitine 3-dehydrogenase